MSEAPMRPIMSTLLDRRYRPPALATSVATVCLPTSSIIRFSTEIRTVAYTDPMKYKALRVKAKGAPTIEKRTVAPRRPTNAAVRPREYLTGEEVRSFLKTARSRPGRNGHRDATMILLAYRHGLRVSELVAMRWV